MSKEHHALINKKLWFAGVMLVITIALLLSQHLPGCSVEKKKAVSQAAGSCEGLEIGGVKEESCNGGSRIFVCGSSGLEEKSNTCKVDANKCVAFDKVSTIFSDNGCAGCHAALGDYETAAPWASKSLARVTLPTEDRKFMPLGKDPLNAANIELIKNWSDSGAKKACEERAPGELGQFGLNYIEANINRAKEKIDQTKRKDRRFISFAHKLNEGADAAELKRYEDGMNKTLNSLNIKNSRLIQAEAIDDNKSIFMFDFTDVGLDARKWDLIENGDKLKIISNTDLGRLLRDTFETDQPWIHGDNFMDITQRNADVYYGILETPLKVSELRASLGVDFAGDLLDLDVSCAGGNDSPISLLKNRLICRWESDDGGYWETFDPIDLNGVPERNLQEFMFLFEQGSKLVFDFAASEVIYTLPNGMQAYGLYAVEIIRDANKKVIRVDGNRANAAPLNIVADNRSPITPEIKNSISCHRCHSAGIIPMRDEIRDAALQNGLDDPLDIDRVRGLFEVQSTMDAIYAKDSKNFGDALSRIGINPAADDPINFATDKFLLDWTVERTASFLLFTSVQEFKNCINQSPIAKRQIGQLITGGRITYNQFVEVQATLVKDCRLFEEPLDD